MVLSIMGQPAAEPGAESLEASPFRASRLPVWLFWALVLCLLPLMVMASEDFGATWDEGERHENGRRVYEYFTGRLPRDQAHHGTLYPALFDVIPAWLSEHVQVDRHVLRHRVNAVFGWIGIVFAGRLAGRLFGPWTGILAAVLLVLSPRYFGHSMNNPKDLPFAAMSVVALYYMSTISSRWPYLSVGAGVRIAVALGLALGTRPGALLYFGYLPVLLAAVVVVNRSTGTGHTPIDWRLQWRAAAESAARVGVVLVVALLLGTVFWPWAQQSPFTRPFEAFRSLSGYDWSGVVLFDGKEYSAGEIPSSYLPTWFLIATPPVVLAGMALSVVLHVRGWGFGRLALWTVALLPIALIIARNTIVYDGMRHALFAYPPMCVLAASGWAGALSQRRRWLHTGAIVLLFLGLANVLAFNVRSYPNQVAYVNELAGGPKGAFGRYELDYWGNCLLQAVDWSANAAQRAQMRVRVWGRPHHIVEWDAARFPDLVVVPEQTDRHHLQVLLFRDSIEDVRTMAARDDIVHRVTTADGAVLCAVFRGPDFEQLSRRLQADLGGRFFETTPEVVVLSRGRFSLLPQRR
jgi:hypothetical protein